VWHRLGASPPDRPIDPNRLQSATLEGEAMETGFRTQFRSSPTVDHDHGGRSGCVANQCHQIVQQAPLLSIGWLAGWLRPTLSIGAARRWW